MIKGDGREGRIGLSKTLVPPVCLTQLLQVVAGETFESIKRMHHQHVTAHVTAPLNFPSTHAPPPRNPRQSARQVLAAGEEDSFRLLALAVGRGLPPSTLWSFIERTMRGREWRGTAEFVAG